MYGDLNYSTGEINARLASLTVNNNEDEDFSISDEKGNKIVSFSNGHVRTKNFDSSRLDESSPSVVSPFEGLKLSILGDSISTFGGYLPSDRAGYVGSPYAKYYPTAEVQDVSNTYWKKLINKLKLKLVSNASWSGSQVCGNSQNTASAESGCSDKRIEDLSYNGEIPDIIIIWIGINDFAFQRGLSNWDSSKPIPQESNNITNFDDAYALMLHKIMTKYPRARLYCCTLLQTKFANYDNVPGFPSDNKSGLVLEQYNNQIRKIATAFGANVIELPSCGITYYNLADYTVDKELHPNIAGFSLIENKIEKTLKNTY